MITQISLDMFFCVVCSLYCMFFLIFFFNDTATTEIYTLSLHDALPISREIDEQSIVAMGQFLARYGAVEFARAEDQWGFLADGTSTYENVKGIVQIARDNNNKVTLASTKTKPSDATLADFRTLRTKVNKA